MFRISGSLSLALAIAGGPLVPCVHALQVENLEANPELDRQRKVLLQQENIRILYSQKDYEGVIRAAEELQKLEPNNATALFYKDNAEARLADGGQSGDGAGGLLQNPPTPVIARPTVTFDPPPPLQPRDLGGFGPQAKRWFEEHKNEVLVGGTLLLLAAILAVVEVRRRGKAARGPQRRGVADMPTAANTRTGLSRTGMMGDLPTSAGIADAVTGAGERENTLVDGEVPPAPLRTPVPTGRPGVGRPTFGRPAASNQPTGGAPPPAAAAPPPPPEPPLEVSGVQLSGIYHEDPVADPRTQAEVTSVAAGSSLGIDYGDTDSPYSQSQAADVQQTGGNAFAEVSAVPAVPPSLAPPAAPPVVLPPLAADDDSEGVTMMGPGLATPVPMKFGPLPPSSTQAPRSAPPSSPAAPPTPPRSAPSQQSGLFDIAAMAPPSPAPASTPRTPLAAATPSMGFASGPAPGPSGGSGIFDIAAAAPPMAPASNEPDALTFNSLMFGGEGTSGLSAPPPAKAAPPAAPPPVMPPVATAGDSDELTLGTFNKQFSDVMFGAGSEATAAPGIPAAPQPAASAPPPLDPDRTAPFGMNIFEANTIRERPAAQSGTFEDFAPPIPNTSMMRNDEDDEDRTLQLPRPPGSVVAAAPKDSGSSSSIGAPKVNMFDRQRDAGREALAAGDFSKAVQCLSVAASLKPNDKEVRELLEEARRKRRG